MSLNTVLCFIGLTGRLRRPNPKPPSNLIPLVLIQCSWKGHRRQCKPGRGCRFLLSYCSKFFIARKDNLIDDEVAVEFQRKFLSDYLDGDTK